MKKTLSLLLVLAMVLSSFGFAFAAEDEIVPAEFLNEKGILKGNATGDLMLEDNLKRQDMVVMLSRLLGVEEEAKAYEGETTFTDIVDPFYVPYIAWAEAEELTEGVGDNKFGFDRAVKENEVAAFLLRALGYTDVEWEDVPAKAVELGLVEKDADLTVDAKREVLANLTYKALGMKMKDSEKTLAEELGIELPGPKEATKVENVYAENLMEIVVVFDGEVDATAAEEASNYATNAGTIDYAELSEDMTTVTLTLKEKMTNQKEYKLEVVGVKAGDKKVTGVFKFAPLDNTLPTVVDIKSLGTKAIKIYASEPIESANASNFKLDGKTYFGTVNPDGRVITLKPYSSTSVLKPGDHTLTVNKLKDYHGLLSLEQTLDFTVVEDNDAPQVVDVTATLEKAVVTFDEDIDPVSASKYNFYWKSGNVKKYPNSVVISGNKAILEFDTNRLPAYETKLYVVNVVDYSGNKMAETEIIINATVDQTRPEVVDVKVSDDAKTITVKFNKNVKADNKAYYVIKAENGKVRTIKSVTGEGKVFTIELYSALPEGVNTIEISGVADTTTLKNVMLPFTYQIEVGDTEAPKVSSVSAHERTIIIAFSETMDLETLANPSNYLIQFNKAWRALPNGTDITPVQDGKAVLIVLPEKIGDTTVNFVKDNVDMIQIMGVKDLAGNILDGYLKQWNLLEAKEPAKPAALDDEYGISEQAAFVDENTIEVKFNQGIEAAIASDFKVTGREIVSVETDGSNIVVLKLKEVKNKTDIAPNAVTIEFKDGKNSLRTVTGNTVANSTITVADLVAPVMISEEAILTKDNDNKVSIKIVFSEELDGTVTNFAHDLVVTRLSDNKPLTPITGYTTEYKESDKTTIVIKLVEFKEGVKYSVGIVDGAKYIEDTNENNPEETDAIETNEAVPEPTKKEKPTGLVGVAPTAKDAKNGKITGTTTDMEYRAKGATDWNAAAATETTGLAAGTYEVRVKANENIPASEIVEVVVPEFKSNVTTITVVEGKAAVVTNVDNIVKALTVAKDITVEDLLAAIKVDEGLGSAKVYSSNNVAAEEVAATEKVTNTMVVVATAEDGTTTAVYTIVVTE